MKLLSKIGNLGQIFKLKIFPRFILFYNNNKQINTNITKSEGGQVLTEFTVMLVMFIGVALTLLLLLAIFTEYGWRIVSLVSLEYP